MAPLARSRAKEIANGEAASSRNDPLPAGQTGSDRGMAREIVVFVSFSRLRPFAITSKIASIAHRLAGNSPTPQPPRIACPYGITSLLATAIYPMAWPNFNPSFFPLGVTHAAWRHPE